jgi:hypothetical protein
MLKGKQAYQYEACNWNFYICKNYQTFRRKDGYSDMSFRVKGDQVRAAKFNW